MAKLQRLRLNSTSLCFGFCAKTFASLELSTVVEWQSAAVALFILMATPFARALLQSRELKGGESRRSKDYRMISVIQCSGPGWRCKFRSAATVNPGR